MISYIIVEYKGKEWVDILVKSIKSTCHLDHEIIIVDNNGGGNSTKGSEGHALGLSRGYERSKGDIVFLLDQDVGFLIPGWDEYIMHMFDEGADLIGAPMEHRTYKEEFLRPHFLGFRDKAYRKKIEEDKGFFRPNSFGDTASMFTYRTDPTKRVLLPNSMNHGGHSDHNTWPDGKYDALFHPGETIYSFDGTPICHHVGRSVPKPERIKGWKEFVNGKCSSGN